MPDTATLLLFPEMPDRVPAEPAGPPDAGARAEALDIRRSFVVEAPAGSGKTGLLIQRYLKLLTDDAVTSPEQVLAITFTNKAAGEMRDRVLGRLQSARDQTPLTGDFEVVTRELAQRVLERDRLLGWALLEQPHRLNLRTIDSVCAEIARSLPVVSGAGGGIAPTAEAEPLFREAARRTLLLLGSSEAAHDAGFAAALGQLLLHRDNNLADCETLLADMLALRDQWAALVPLTGASLTDESLDTEVLPRLQRALEQAICAGLTQVAKAFPPHLLDDLADIAGHLGHATPKKSGASPIAPCAGLHRAPGAVAADRDRWAALAHLLLTKDGSWRKERGINGSNVGFEYDRKHPLHTRLSRILDELRDRDDLREELAAVAMLPPAVYPADQWAVAKVLFRVLRRALVELQLVFAARGQCDFTEVSLLARAALRTGEGREDLIAALGARLQHLLVDEMQDTSSSQYELIQVLTESWDGHSQTVFLVGDPRQSIYLFRQARVERFLGTLRSGLLGDLPLTRLRLSANFRSQARVVEQLNAAFASIFAPDVNGAKADQVLPFSPADAVLPSTPDAQALRWHANPVSISSRTEADTEAGTTTPTDAQLRRQQARRNAAEIRRIAQIWSARPLPTGRTEPWRLAVLVRSRAHLAEVTSALRAEDAGERIPFRAVEIEPLAERQEILDLTALTRALLHPADRAAGLALLRAPWCGLCLADLHALAGSDQPEFQHHSIQRLMAERGHLLSPEGCARMQRLWNVFAAAAAQRGRRTTAQLVEAVWRTLGGDAALRDDELINSRRFLRLLDEIAAESTSTGAALDTSVLARRLQKLYAEPQAVPSGAPFVELLTIHRAKGLEWDVVMIPALERGPGRGRTRLLNWAELEGSTQDGASPVMLAPIAARGEDADALTRWVRRIHSEHEAAERKRLFYVAATRARQELHLFASPDLTPQGALRSAWDSLLKSAAAAAEPHLAPSQQQNVTQSFQSAGAVVDLAAAATVSEMPRRHHPAAQTPPAAIDTDLYGLPPRPQIDRLPASFDPQARFADARERRLAWRGQDNGAPAPADATRVSTFTRPEGSFAARAFGNVVHALLENAAVRLSQGTIPASLLIETRGWGPRVQALLRAEGLSPAESEKLSRQARAALESTLRDPDGAWLLAPHPQSANELAITAAAASGNTGHIASIRVDRIFRAGPEPQQIGAEYLWVIDYKTGAHGSSGLEKFLAAQRETYAPQLERYAEILATLEGLPLTRLRAALYYPGIPKLLWWRPGPPLDATPEATLEVIALD